MKLYNKSKKLFLKNNLGSRLFKESQKIKQ